MKNIFCVLMFLLISCDGFSQTNIDSLKIVWKKQMNEKKEKNLKRDLYAFIGEKISVEKFQSAGGNIKLSHEDSIKGIVGRVNFNHGYVAKYKVVKNIHNELKIDTIQFKAFDHHGIPQFSKYKNVLLFVIKEDGKYLHSKYQYFDLYKTKDNRWGGPYSKTKYRETRIKPVKLEFKEEVSIELNPYLRKHRDFLFPIKYFRYEEDKVIPLYGNYVEDLFTIKKEGVLKARGYFK